MSAGQATPRLSPGGAAVIGVGHTDWAEDYRRTRAGERPGTSESYAARAFVRALADSGIGKSEIDGLIVGPTTPYERTAESLGLNPRWGGQEDAVGAVVNAVMAIQTGMAEVVALVYGNDQRSAKVQYGGPQAAGGDRYLSYIYHAPWGLTSQGALYALMFQRYKEIHGITERELGEVAVAQRLAASLNDNAIMRKRLTIEDYMEARYICAPLRLYDYCLINDGGVALVIASADRARRAAGAAVGIRGVGRSDLNAGATTFEPRLTQFYRPAQQAAGRASYEMAGVGPQDMDAVQIYDSFSCHIPFALEGFGYCGEGEAGRFMRDHGISLERGLPVNTAGGHLSETYMQGWAHQIEAVRQVRGECGARQVPGCRHVQYCSDVAGKAFSIIYGEPA
ncbi:lipid-transfer protein [Rhodobacteraceae bacterium WD3A24]|nr:lipid-transfer protein [Rhodobacteraceae bacterium WD3A24]